MSDLIHEKLWDVTLLILQIVGYFLIGKYNATTKLPVEKKRIRIHNRNIFMAYVAVKSLRDLGFYAEWEPR